jgi:hypothetical protein
MANLIRWRRGAREKGENNEQCNNVVQGNKLSRPLRLIVFAFRYDLLTPRHISALRTSHTWAVWSGRVWLTVLALFALQLLAVCHTGDRIPGRITCGSPTMNKQPWTPGGSKRARGPPSVPNGLPVVSIVPACSTDGSRPPSGACEQYRTFRVAVVAGC